MTKYIKVKCKKCSYSWKTKSKLIFVSCSSCGQKVQVRPMKKEGEENG